MHHKAALHYLYFSIKILSFGFILDYRHRCQIAAKTKMPNLTVVTLGDVVFG
jgi:hypothetical protein